MIPSGYKQTDIGLIPEDWEIKQIGKFTDAVAGGTPNTTIPEYWGGDIPWMSSGELNKRRVHSVDGRITKTGLENSSTHMIPENCVLVGLAGQGKTRGTVAVNYISLCTNQSIAAIFPNDQVETEYLYQNLYSRYDELRELSSGDGGRGGLNLKLIKNLIVPIPPLPEQRRIAEALSDVDELIASLEKLIEKKKALKQGVMQELLTGKRRLPGFTGEWVERSFSDLFDHISSRDHQIQTTEYLDYGLFPVIDQGKEKIVAYSDDYSKIIDSPKDGAIVFGDHTRIVKHINGSFIIGADGVQILTSKQNHSTIFLYYLLENLEIPNMGYNRHFKFIKNTIFLIPPDLDEEWKIASVIFDIEQSIRSLEDYHSKYCKLKSGMMSELLTGRVRLAYSF